MTSIRRYLLKTLILALVGGSAFTSLLVYRNAAEEINELYDKNMQEVALLLHDQIDAPASLTPPSSALNGSVRELKGEEEVLIQVWYENGTLAYTSHPAIPMPLQSATGASMATYQGQEWHAYRTPGPAIVQLAQPDSARHAFVQEMALNMLYPMLLQIPLIGFLIWLAVGKSLSPLMDVSRAIHRRSATSLAPITGDAIPGEILPMVQALNALLQRLNVALDAQRQFTANAAHELRTPLAALKLQLSNLQRAADEAEGQVAIAKLHSGIDRATHVVHQLLTLARLEPKAAVPQENPVALTVIVRQSIEAYAEIAYEKQIDLGCPRLEDVQVLGEADSIRIVIDNLIDNAIRYTPSGGKVDVSLYGEEGNAILLVQDTGIGIAEHERERIFERFYRVIGTQTNGTGLGLAIVKHIVGEHAGKISVSTGIEHAGTGIRIALPLHA